MAKILVFGQEVPEVATWGTSLRQNGQKIFFVRELSGKIVAIGSCHIVK
jgi:hypothetical protein